VAITGESFDLAGSSLTIELDSRRAVLQGAVRGTFSGQLAAQPF
jgi:hypothetical protein